LLEFNVAQFAHCSKTAIGYANKIIIYDVMRIILASQLHTIVPYHYCWFFYMGVIHSQQHYCHIIYMIKIIVIY